MDIVIQQMLEPACRLLTLTGPGGVGKTRLAVEVVRRLESQFGDGVFFLSMAGVSQPESILLVLADALGLIFSGPADPKLQIIQALRKKNLLLVMDNMEHLVAGCGVLGEILEHTPGVRILITSREPVHLQWEWIFEVQGLPIPESAQPDLLESNSAPALFLQRTRQAARRMEANAGPGSAEKLAAGSAAKDAAALDAAAKDAEAKDAAAIVKICRLVDGLPLAIELAASWARVMSPAEIADELAHGMGLLETTLQDVPARHRSMRLVFDHSWKLLSEEERSAMMRLAVFPGGFTREAALQVAGASVLLLSALVSKSLLRYGKKAGRYDIHELVRQYALARLSEVRGLEHAAYRLHAEYFTQWVFNLEAALKSAQQVETSARLRAETPNWSAAWRWAARHQRLDLLRQMTPCLYWFAEIHGDNLEGLAFYAYTVNELRAAGAPQALVSEAHKANFALLLAQLGWFEFRTGQMERAIDLFKESLALADSLQTRDAYVYFLIYINWGYLAVTTGDTEAAGRLLPESLRAAQEVGHPWNIAVSSNILGIVEFQRGNVAEAYQQLTDSLKVWRAVGDLRGLVFCMLYLSMAALAQGDHETAEALLIESNAMARHKLDRWAHALGLDVLGQVAVARGSMADAADCYRQSLALSQEIGDQWSATQAMLHLGDAQAALNNLREAQQLLHQAYDSAQQAHWLGTMLEVLVAFVAADADTPPDTRLCVVLAVLDQPALAQAARLRAEQLRAGLADALTTQQVEAARSRAPEKTIEQWAGVLFQKVLSKRAFWTTPA
jgi:predicted ATPase